MGTFAQDVAVEPLGGGRYRADLGDSWNLALFPQGGIVAAVGLRAAAEAADTAGTADTAGAAQALRSVTTVFAGPVSPGALDITATVLRRGRSATQVMVEVRNTGAQAGTVTLAVFGADRRGPTFIDAQFPNVPRPSMCPSYRDPAPGGMAMPQTWPFWQRVEGRSAMGRPPWERFESTTSDVAAWLRFDEPPRLDDGGLAAEAVVALADRMPGAIGQRLGNHGDPWFAPSADLTVHLFQPVRTEWILAHDRARWAANGWASLETTLWDEERSLIAYATQMVIVSYLDS